MYAQENATALSAEREKAIEALKQAGFQALEVPRPIMELIQALFASSPDNMEVCNCPDCTATRKRFQETAN